MRLLRGGVEFFRQCREAGAVGSGTDRYLAINLERVRKVFRKAEE
jgi:hypothetical protein